MAGTMGGGMNLDGGDPRMGSSAGQAFGDNSTPTRKALQKTHDPSVTLEEYLHFAAIARADRTALMEGASPTDDALKVSGLRGFNPIKGTKAGTDAVTSVEIAEKSTAASPDRPQPIAITDEEYIQASRAVRTATWGAVFFLITTDILGPWSTAWAFRQMGYGPGVALYTVFGVLAGYGGWLLWKMFLALDSDRYPLRTYSDIAFRIYGPVTRHSINFLQSIQLLFAVGLIIVANGQSLPQMAAKGPDLSQNGACFIILCFVWAIAGRVFGQVRTLAKLGYLANFAIWLNVFTIISTMAIVSHSGPNYVAADKAYEIDHEPIYTTVGPPSDVAFQGQIVGLMQAVYSYGGAMLFVEFMAEMCRPYDFWKGVLCAQLLIYFVYMLYGLFVYSYQGQYTINPAPQGVSIYAWQTANNALNLASSLIAAMLYGNIGIKVVYNNLLMEHLHFPHLGRRAGKLCWVAVVPVYWGLAFIVAAAIPQISNLSGFIAALCIHQFSYTFPPFLHIGFRIQQDALQEGEGFDPATGQTHRHDGGWRRWVRGYKKAWLVNTWNLVFMLGSLTTAVLGIYSSVLGMIESYATNASTSFGCDSPVLG